MKGLIACVLVGIGSSGLAQPGATTRISVNEGVREAGNLLSLLAPDGNRFTVRAAGSSFKRIEIVLTSENPLFRLPTAQRINVYFKWTRSLTGAWFVDVFNWQRGAWETKDIRYDINHLDRSYQLAGGHEFFSPTGQVKLRLRSMQSQTFRFHLDAFWLWATP